MQNWATPTSSPVLVLDVSWLQDWSIASVVLRNTMGQSREILFKMEIMFEEKNKFFYKILIFIVMNLIWQNVVLTVCLFIDIYTCMDKIHSYRKFLKILALCFRHVTFILLKSSRRCSALWRHFFVFRQCAKSSLRITWRVLARHRSSITEKSRSRLNLSWSSKSYTG